jgi:arabinofuranan 3-O-arabinosyltransferase
VVYPPLLLTAPGSVVADTKTYLYTDPGRLLGRAMTMWDPHVGLGTVPHQQIGYLWPMGPYYWAMEQLGLPDWVAQRLWIGSIMVAAGAGVLFLARTWRWRPEAAAAAAFVYGLSPYVLTLAARISVILLAFAGLPWLLALTVRALRTRGWRHPALFGLVVATIGSVNATALLLVGIVPVGWILYALVTSPDVSRARATSTMAKIGLVTVVVNAWWIIGLSVQATNGIDVLRYTETAEVVANASTAPEVLRGLGYWFFYGGDRLGPWIEPGEVYTQNLAVIALSYAIPVIGLLALGITRWRDRAFVVGMLTVGTVVAVGAHPWEDPSLAGELFKVFLSSDVGLAMRSLPRAVPLVALAIALGIGALVGAAAEERAHRGIVGAALAAILAMAALPALWTGQFVPENLRRPEELPDYWEEAAAYLDRRDDGTRVLEIPGTDFASYRWGNTVDPITPGLMDRPYVARELIPYGSPASADLLDALDLELQERTLEPEALAPLARLMAVGDVVTRNDVQYERYNTPRPRSLWALVTDAPGLGEPRRFGPTDPNVPVAEAPLLDELHLALDGALADPPAVAAFPVEDAEPIVRTKPHEHAVLLSGNGAGVVDAAMAGLIDGDELIRYSASVTDDPDFAREHLTGDRALIVTDTNRARAQRWTTVRHTQGYTEEAEGGLLGEPDPTDQRLELFEERPGTRSVAEHRGLTVRATGYGNPITYTPEERPVNAVDGDPTTAWRVAAFEDAVGERIEISAPEPVTTDHVTLLQPINGAINRTITEVELRFDGEDPTRVRLGDASQHRPGQRVDFPERTFERLSVEILADSAGDRPGYSGLTSVGFASIDIAGRTAEEVIRMPSDLLEAGGFRTVRYPLALVQTRQRSAPTDVTRMDEEHSMRRVVDLPTERSYQVSGTARPHSGAPTAVLDAVLGRRGAASGQPAVEASSVLPGGLAHLPSNVLDRDPSTRWTSELGSPEGESLVVTTPAPVTTTTVDVTLVDDDQHSVPGTVTVSADGNRVGSVHLSDRRTARSGGGGGTVTSTLDLAGPVTASRWTFTFSDVVERETINWNTDDPEALPLSVTEIEVGGTSVPPRPDVIETGCRDDLVNVDGEAVPVRVSGTTDDALAGRGLDVTGCGAVSIPGGERLFTTADGRDLGIAVDQLTWCSAGGGAPCADPAELVPPVASTAPRVTVTDSDDATVEVRIDGATPGVPFWLVLGQSYNQGWEILDDVEHEPTQLVDGYANGFLVTPADSAFEVTMRFVPQNRVDVGLLLSLIGAVGAVFLILLPTRQVRTAQPPLLEPVRLLRATSWEGALPTHREALAVGLVAGAATAALVTVWMGLVVGVAAGLSARRERWRPLFTLGAPVLLAICAGYLLVFQYRNEIGPGLHWVTDTGRLHELGLTAVLLLAVDVGISFLWARRSEYR